MIAVSLTNVSKSYDQFVAVDGLSFEIPAGEIYGLLGPNGAGKTSTLRMMIGITIPDSGSIQMFGAPFSREQLRRIGYLPEERGLYRKMKVLEHLVFLGELKGVSRKEAAAKAGQWLERLGLSSWKEKKIEALSKGMQQKVQFISTLLHDPEFIVMDEPFAGLDPSNMISLKDALLDLNKSGKTILFSSHRMDQVERLCDSICLINRGRSVLQGNLQNIKAGYGRRHVQIEYEGDSAFLQSPALVQSFNDYGNYVEVQLAPGASAQDLLQQAAARARLLRFEVMEPSVEEIFLDKVGKAEDEGKSIALVANRE